MASTGRLFVFCGKMAAGKSTLAKALVERESGVLLAQDAFIARLYPSEIVDVPAYLTYSARLRDALEPHILALLAHGLPVILDFPGNTRAQRAWFRHLIDASGAAHELHLIEAADEVCKRQLRERSRGLPEGTAWTTDAEFDAITAYYDPPTADERFVIVRHERR
jgi:predicted kinase